MIDPVELLAAMDSAWNAIGESAREDVRYMRRKEIAALEAAGFRIAHPDAITEAMLTAAEQKHGHLRQVLRAIVAAAPLYGKG